MQWQILQATNQCQYKTWQLAKEAQPELLTLKDNEINFPYNTISVQDKIAITVWYTNQIKANERGSYSHVAYKNTEYSWQLKALALREKKIFILQTPDP